MISALRQARRRRVTTIRSPAGSGKSTTLAMLARSSVDCFAWYTIDELDRDPGALLFGLETAISLALERPAEVRRAFDRNAGLARVVAGLETLGTRGGLIVDDVHRLDTPGAFRDLADLIRYLPRGSHLVLAGRELPRELMPVLDWCAAQKQLTAFSWLDLQLSADEQSAAVSLYSKRGAEPWILAWSAEPSWDIAEYLRIEVIEPLGAGAVALLAFLAILPSFDVRLAATIANRSTEEIQGLLDRLSQATPLLTENDDGTYRFGEAGREVLLGFLEREAREAAILRAGSALRSSDPVRSADYFIQADERVEAARSLALVPLLDWMSQSPSPAHDVLARLSLDCIQGFPVLMLARAWADYAWAGRTSEALGLVQDILSRETGVSDVAFTYWVHYIAARALLATGQAVDARRHRLVLRQTVATLRDDPRGDVRHVARALVGLAIVERVLGDGAMCRQAAELGLALAALSPAATGEERVLLHHVLGNDFYLDASYDQAETHFLEAQKILSRLTSSLSPSAMAHPLSGIARHRGEYTRALSILEEALQAPILPARERALLTLQTAHVLLDLGDFQGAGQRYRLVASWFREPDRDGCFSRSLAGLSICCSKLGLAREAELTLASLRPLDSGPLSYDLALARGILELQAGNFDQAAARFDAARAVGGTVGGVRDAWQAVLLLAQARLGQGRKALAERAIREFLATLGGRSVPEVAAWISEPVASLLHQVSPLAGQADGERGERPRGGRQLSSLRHAISITGLAAPGPTRRVELHVFGPPRLVLDGQSLEWPRGLRHKAIELFWYAALHPDGFSRDQAQADLFPERDAPRGSDLLQTTIADLRRTLTAVFQNPGDRILVRRGDGSYHLCFSSVASWLVNDVQQLTEVAASLRESRRKPPPADVPGFFRGELLAGLTAEWLQPIRRYWMAVYLRTLAALAHRYSKQGELQQAIRCHELALQIDPTLTSSHAELLRLFHAAGDRQAIEAQRWLYQRVARDELGLPAESDFEDLYRQLTTASE